MLFSADEIIKLKEIQLNITVLVELTNKKKIPQTESLLNYKYNALKDAVNTLNNILNNTKNEYTTLSN